jgi:ubiquinone/menaquinone biosynthesis C-methylase UbiE
VSTASYHHWERVDPIVSELSRVLKPSGVLWLYDLRPAPMAPFHDAAAHVMPDRTVRSSLVRTGRLPFATWRRLTVTRAG